MRFQPHTHTYTHSATPPASCESNLDRIWSTGSLKSYPLGQSTGRLVSARRGAPHRTRRLPIPSVAVCTNLLILVNKVVLVRARTTTNENEQIRHDGIGFAEDFIKIDQAIFRRIYLKIRFTIPIDTTCCIPFNCFLQKILPIEASRPQAHIHNRPFHINTSVI